MLVLMAKPGDTIYLEDDRGQLTTVTYMEKGGSTQIRLGFTAPKTTSIERAKVRNRRLRGSRAQEGE